MSEIDDLDEFERPRIGIKGRSAKDVRHKLKFRVLQATWRERMPKWKRQLNGVRAAASRRTGGRNK